MKPLSVFKFMKGSAGKILPLAVTAGLAVGLLYFLSIINRQSLDDKKEMNVTYLSNISIIYRSDMPVINENSPGVTAADIEALKQNSHVRDVYVAGLCSVDYKTFTDSAKMFMFLMKNKDMAAVMKWENLKLAKGSMPKNPGEIALHRKLALNWGLKVGSVISKNTAGWGINQDMVVTGIFDGPAIIGLGAGDESGLNPGAQGTSVIAATDDADVHQMNRFIVKQYGKRYMARTLDTAQKSLDRISKNIDVVTVLLGAAVVLALSFLLGNIVMIQYDQRAKEFELLHAVGYTRKYIAVKVLKELGSSNFLGYAAGITASIFGGWVVNVCVLSEKAEEMALIRVENMLWILIVPVFITAFGMIAPLKLLKFKDIM